MCDFSVSGSSTYFPSLTDACTLPYEEGQAEHSVQFESDIAEEPLDFGDHYDSQCHNDIPPRPTSRLGFNHSSRINQDQPDIAQCSDVRDVEDQVDMDITAFIGATAPQSEGVHTDTSADGMPHGEKLDGEHEMSCSKYRLPSLVPLAPIAAPFPITPAVQLVALSTPSPRPTFSCLPSPLSRGDHDNFKYSTYCPHTPIPMRHHYGQHGYSRHALLQLRWFWATRETAWEERQLAASSPARLAVAIDSASTPESHALPTLPPLTIHPRRGDISALRDPYCMLADRSFVTLPTWTLGKMLWMYDVHSSVERAAKLCNTEDSAQEDSGGSELGDGDDSSVYSDDDSSDLNGSSSPANFSDESDVTLVESEGESESEESFPCPAARKETRLLDVPDSVESDRLGQTSRCSSRPSTRIGRRILRAKGRSTKAEVTRPSWIVSWYSRWELVAQLVTMGHGQAPPDEAPLSFRKQGKKPKFFLSDEEEDGERVETAEQWWEVLVSD